jgi:16S rRNA (adenine1518-N6/adenine1519-N6)-dimethyltransferase
MHTKHQIQELLATYGHEPNKRLGQNFLIDLNLINFLVETANIQPTDVVLEVGTGTGSLSEALAKKAAQLIAVEYDNTLAEITTQTLEPYKNTQLINSDILKNKNNIAPQVLDALETARQNHPARTLLVANLPYAVACPVIMNLITAQNPIDAMYVTVQKEVAQRLTSEVYDVHYGSISIILAATGNAKYIKTLKPTVFWPQPQINSAMISWTIDHEKLSRIKSLPLLLTITSLFMQHRRKTVNACTKLAKKNLKINPDWQKIFAAAQVPPTVRPDRISPEQYVTIANLCHDISQSS